MSCVCERDEAPKIENQYVAASVDIRPAQINECRGNPAVTNGELLPLLRWDLKAETISRFDN